MTWHGPLLQWSRPRANGSIDIVDPEGVGVQGEGVFLGNPKDSVWEDWGTFGKIREDYHPPLRIPLVFIEHVCFSEGDLNVFF